MLHISRTSRSTCEYCTRLASRSLSSGSRCYASVEAQSSSSAQNTEPSTSRSTQPSIPRSSAGRKRSARSPAPSSLSDQLKALRTNGANSIPSSSHEETLDSSHVERKKHDEHVQSARGKSAATKGKGRMDTSEDGRPGDTPEAILAFEEEIESQEASKILNESDPKFEAVQAHFETVLQPLLGKANKDPKAERKLRNYLKHWILLYRTAKTQSRPNIIRKFEETTTASKPPVKLRNKENTTTSSEEVGESPQEVSSVSEAVKDVNSAPPSGPSKKVLDDELFLKAPSYASTTTPGAREHDVFQKKTKRTGRMKQSTAASSADSLESFVKDTNDSKARPSLVQQSHIPDIETATINPKEVIITPLKPIHDAEVATLAHGLDRVLSKRRYINYLQNPFTLRYNFDKRLQDIPLVESFNFDSLPKFVSPSQDDLLKEILKNNKRLFAGSTSSLTSAFSQIYFTINGKKELQSQSLNFEGQPRTFSGGAQIPASIRLKLTEDGTYLIDSDKSVEGGSTESILSKMGHVLEKKLTYTPEEFERFQKDTTKPLTPDEGRDKREAYHYSSTESLVMRSQLDCRDPNDPTKTFDIKTRATMAIRFDMENHRHNAGYYLWRRLGKTESFEKEKYDLIRSAFLKYSMQARIGAMDGIFLAYHSTQRVYGFEYLSVEDIDKLISGSHEESSQAFSICVGLFEKILLQAVADQPGVSLRMTFDSVRPGTLQVFCAPEGDDSAEPLHMYTITTTNYINGEALSSKEPVDFVSVVQQQAGIDASAEVDSNESPKVFLKESDISWIVAYDITPSKDSAYNQKAFKAVRKEQNRFRMAVALPDGLTEAQIKTALKGTPEENEEIDDSDMTIAAASEAEEFDEKASSGSLTGFDFSPRPGIRYTARVSKWTKRIRQMATWGWERQERDKVRYEKLLQRAMRVSKSRRERHRVPKFVKSSGTTKAISERRKARRMKLQSKKNSGETKVQKVEALFTKQ